MRLIEKRVKTNPETFTPEILVTVALPLELIRDNTAMYGEEVAFEKISAAFIDILKTF